MKAPARSLAAKVLLIPLALAVPMVVAEVVARIVWYQSHGPDLACLMNAWDRAATGFKARFDLGRPEIDAKGMQSVGPPGAACHVLFVGGRVTFGATPSRIEYIRSMTLARECLLGRGTRPVIAGIRNRPGH